MIDELRVSSSQPLRFSNMLRYNAYSQNLTAVSPVLPHFIEGKRYHQQTREQAFISIHSVKHL